MSLSPLRRAWRAVASGRSLDAQFAASLSALSSLGGGAGAGASLDWSGVRARETLALLSAQLVRAALPASLLSAAAGASPSPSAVSDALLARAAARPVAGSSRGDALGQLCVALCAVDGLGGIAADRAGALASQRSGSRPYEKGPARVEQPGVLPGYDVAF